MKLDNETQGRILIDLINASNIPGSALEAVLEVKTAIGRALADLRKPVPEAEHVDDMRP
jgi:hypothetical protein